MKKIITKHKWECPFAVDGITMGARERWRRCAYGLMYRIPSSFSTPKRLKPEVVNKLLDEGLRYNGAGFGILEFSPVDGSLLHIVYDEPSESMRGEWEFGIGVDGKPAIKLYGQFSSGEFCFF